jgi:DNA-binding SARP family transcriptional activator
MRLTLLGCFRLEDGDRPPPQPGGQRLLAALATHGPLTRRRARELLWPDVPEPQSRARLRSTLWRLGAGPAEAPLVAAAGEALNLHPGIEVDLSRLVQAAGRLIGPADTPPTDRDLDVVASHAAELLPGWYDDWVLLERERVRQLRARALEALADVECRRGRYAIAIDAALAAIGLEPLREPPHRVLLQAYLGENNLVEAARHLHAYTALLGAELGVEPSPGLVALVAERGVPVG